MSDDTPIGREAAASGADIPPRAARRARTSLLLLVALCALPPIAAWTLYTFPDALPIRQSAYGQLIRPPHPLGRQDFRTLDGEAYPASRLAGEWNLLWVASNVTGEALGMRLQLLRNLRLALRQDATHLRYYALVDASQGAPGRKDIARKFSEATVLVRSIEGGAVPSGTPAFRLDDGYYLVDPLGNVMMRYLPDAEAKGILKDLEKLLKYSQAGR